MGVKGQAAGSRTPPLLPFLFCSLIQPGAQRKTALHRTDNGRNTHNIRLIYCKDVRQSNGRSVATLLITGSGQKAKLYSILIQLQKKPTFEDAPKGWRAGAPRRRNRVYAILAAMPQLMRSMSQLKKKGAFKVEWLYERAVSVAWQCAQLISHNIAKPGQLGLKAMQIDF